MHCGSLSLIFSLWRVRLRINRHGSLWLVVHGLLLPGTLSLWAQSHATSAGFSRHVIIGTFVLGLYSLVAKRAGQSVAAERAHGVWTLLATTRVTRNVYLAAQVLDLLVLVTIPLLGIGIAAILYPQLSPRSVLWIVPTLLSTLCFGAIALLIAGVVRRQLCGLTINLMLVSVLAFCPMLYPDDRVPAAIWPVVRVLPPTLAMEAVAPAWNGVWPPLGPVALLGMWGVIAGALVIAVFPWTERGARNA